MGEWWYLVYSTFTERCVTHYRISRSLEGPWLAPPDDVFDSRAFYAAKTVSDGQRRFLFGWLATRVDEKDDGGWQWGGNLVVHEIHQRLDGTLAVCLPQPLQAAFSRQKGFEPSPVLGEWQVTQGYILCESIARNSMLLMGNLPDEILVEVEFSFTPGTSAFGLLLRADPALESYYQLRFEPPNQRMVVDRWPRPGDQPFMLERSAKLQADIPTSLQIILSGSCLLAYLNGETALSCRLYDHPQGNLGLFISEGAVRFDVKCFLRP
jgi:beta-fructofuranosidase